MCKWIPILMPRPPSPVASFPSFLQWTIMLKWLLERTGCRRKNFSVDPRGIKCFGMILNPVAADSPILCVLLTHAEVWEKSSWTILDNFLFNALQTSGKGMRAWNYDLCLFHWVLASALSICILYSCLAGLVTKWERPKHSWYKYLLDR